MDGAAEVEHDGVFRLSRFLSLSGIQIDLERLSAFDVLPAGPAIMTFERRILHHGPHPEGTPQLLSLTALRSCWFELHRQGGCGAGELVLADDFHLRHQIEVGDWISMEVSTGTRWYLGRVEERAAEVPAQIRFRLEGMAVELNQVFPGGFGGDGEKPHRYGAADLFSADPDRDQETADVAGTADEVVRLLMTQYVNRTGHLRYDPSLIEPSVQDSSVVSLKLRGEESVRSLLKDLALRAQAASWGVDPAGNFFFLRPRNTLRATYQEQRDLVSLTETCDVELLFNRLLLTGDYVYDLPLADNDVARRAYRWRGNYFEPDSRSQYGDRRLKIWLPWVRTQSDSLAFAREFFRAYSQPVNRYLIETTGQTELPFPWLGRVRLQAANGTELARSRIETIRVLFDHVPRFRMELGPEDPRQLWPEPPQDERWEIPHQPVAAGGPVSDPPPVPSSGGNNGGTTTPSSSSGVPTSGDDSGTLSNDSSVSLDNSLESSSEDSSHESSEETSDGPVISSSSPWIPSIAWPSSQPFSGVDTSEDSWEDFSSGIPSSAVISSVVVSSGGTSSAPSSSDATSSAFTSSALSSSAVTSSVLSSSAPSSSDASSSMPTSSHDSSSHDSSSHDSSSAVTSSINTSSGSLVSTPMTSGTWILTFPVTWTFRPSSEKSSIDDSSVDDDSSREWSSIPPTFLSSDFG